MKFKQDRMNPSLAKPTIFLVDDDPDEQVLLREALQRITNNHYIRIAIHGKHLLDLLSVASDSELPCLIILDNNMPVMDGKETLLLLQANGKYRKIPTIIYSTSDMLFEKEEFVELGACAYITKPVTIQGIVEAAKEMMDYCNGGQKAEGRRLKA